MSETDTITRNAVQELLELPVANPRLPKDFVIEIKARQSGKMAELTKMLEQLSEIDRRRLYEAAPRPISITEQVRVWQASIPVIRHHYGRTSTYCMPSRHRPWMADWPRNARRAFDEVPDGILSD